MRTGTRRWGGRVAAGLLVATLVLVGGAAPASAAYKDYTFPNGCKVQGGNGSGGPFGRPWSQTKKRSNCAEIRADIHYQRKSDGRVLWTYGGWTTSSEVRIRTAYDASTYYKTRHWGAKTRGQSRQSFELAK